MPRYQSARDFWDIQLTGRTIITTTGRIASGVGKSTTKKYRDHAAALADYVKQIEAKTRNRFNLVWPKQPATPRRFEAGDKFWEIAIDGATLRTRSGKLGAQGHTKLDKCETADGARAKYNTFVAHHLAKGFVEPGHAREPELERAIEQDPRDATAYAVLGDRLQERGDPRGELIALQLAGRDGAAHQLLVERSEHFLGPLAEHAECYDHLYYKPSPPAFTWRNGFIHAVRISYNQYWDSPFKGDIARVLELALRHPSGRFVTEVTIMDGGGGSESDLQSIIDTLAKLAPPTVRKLVIGDQVDQISWYSVGNLGKLWRAVPRLEELEIEAGSFELGTIELPALRRAVFHTGGLTRASARAIARAKWPQLEHLVVYYGDSNYGCDCTIADVVPLLARSDLPKLTHLAVANAEFADAICGELPASKLVKQLRTLDLSNGMMTDDGARTLVANKRAFAHLETLDVRDNYLSKAAIKSLAGVARNVLTDSQKDDEGDPEMRWVSVGE